MNKFNQVLVAYLSEHWQFILGGLLYFIGRDILSAALHNYWIQHLGIFSQDIALGLLGFKAVSVTSANASLIKKDIP